MKTSEAQALIAQVRLLEARAHALENRAAAVRAPDALSPAAGAGDPRFSDLMVRSLEQVNATMADAQRETTAFLREAPGANLVETMVAVNKAKVSFRTMVEIRNQLIQAYKDIANMPV